MTPWAWPAPRCAGRRQTGRLPSQACATEDRQAISQGDEGAFTATTGNESWLVSAVVSRDRSTSQADSPRFACLQSKGRTHLPCSPRAAVHGGKGSRTGISGYLTPSARRGVSAAGSHPRHRLFGRATPGPRHHTTSAASNPAPDPARQVRSSPIPRGARGRSGHSSIAAPAVSEAAGPGGAPAATWRFGGTTAILGREEALGPRFAVKPQPPEGRPTRREKDRRNF